MMSVVIEGIAEISGYNVRQSFYFEDQVVVEFCFLYLLSNEQFKLVGVLQKLVCFHTLALHVHLQSPSPCGILIGLVAHEITACPLAPSSIGNLKVPYQLALI